MKHVLTLTHSDECSGITLMDDGTKVYWTDGHSVATIIYADGRTEYVDVMLMHPVLDALNHMSEEGLSPQRQMTAAEETDYEMTANNMLT